MRKLVLRRENLSDLTAADLAVVAGGQQPQATTECPDYTYYCLSGPAICNLESRVICS
jgi:hypothetical protein